MSARVRVSVALEPLDLARVDEIAVRLRLSRSAVLREAIAWLYARNARYALVADQREARRRRDERDDRRRLRERRQGL
jgi:predicted transcriptional regulator